MTRNDLVIITIRLQRRVDGRPYLSYCAQEENSVDLVTIQAQCRRAKMLYVEFLEDPNYCKVIIAVVLKHDPKIGT